MKIEEIFRSFGFGGVMDAIKAQSVLVDEVHPFVPDGSAGLDLLRSILTQCTFAV